MSRVSRLPLRVRLTAGFSVAMLLVLSAAGTFVYWRVQYALDRGLDGELDRAAATIGPLVGPEGHLARGSRRTAQATGVAWQVLGPDGDVLDAGGPAPAPALVAASRLPTSGASEVVDVGGLLASEPYRARLSSLDGAAGPVLVVGVRRDRRDEALRELLLQLLLAGLGALVVTAFVGERLARAALRPVEDYRRRAASITAGDTRVRLEVPEGREDEVTRLGHTLNDMLGAQEAALERERRFVHEASHELRTPLTLLRGRIQLTRRRQRSGAELESALDELLVDVGRLGELAEHLLELGGVEQGAAGGGRADVGDVVAEAVARLGSSGDAVAPAGVGRSLAGVMVPLAARDLDRAVTNLVANARTHGTAPVDVGLRREGEWVLVEVTDAGPGMPEELLEVATHRFTRADEARSRPGAGLGLALVEALADGAGGELRLCAHGRHVSHPRRTPPGCRHAATMTATLVLPVAPPGGTARLVEQVP